MAAFGRRFVGALIVSVLSLVVISGWLSPGNPLGQLLWALALFTVIASVCILGAALLAAFLNFLAGRFLQPGERYRWLIATALGSLSGLAVMAVTAGHIDPPAFMLIATVAGGTGGALSATEFPLSSWRGLLVLGAGVAISLGAQLGLPRSAVATAAVGAGNC